MEPTRWTVRVSSDGGDGSVAFARTVRLEVGAPISFDPEYPRATALEQVLAAVASDVVAGLVALARTRRLELDHVEAVVHGELQNPLVALGVVGEEGHPGLDRIALKVYVDTLEEEPRVRALFAEMLHRSPLVNTFRRCLRLDVILELVL